jgi:glucose 1-dehydrogenase/sorbitol-6-phosphate 2-dehydrogenase
MQLNLDRQKVAVFGGARGIGRAIADAFLSERCQVWTFDREQNEATVPPGQASVLGDVTHYDEVQIFADTIGDVDHVIYSIGAGSGKFGFPFWNLDPADWARVLEINLIGAVNVAHAFAPKLVARGKGSMLFLVSVAGQIGSQTDPPYSAAKAGLINFTQCAAKDLAPYGVRVNALSPGMVKTDLNRSVWQAGQALLSPSQRQDYEVWAEEKIRKVSPLGRWQTPPEYAAMAVFLASDHAKNITGQTINIDGGQVMHS